jgi:sRNA-binding carbon storage regulator CsrA
MNINDITRLGLTINRDQKIVIDGIVEIFISTGPNSKTSPGSVTLTIQAPRDILIKRQPKYPNGKK